MLNSSLAYGQNRALVDPVGDSGGGHILARTKPRQRSQCADGNRLTLGQSLDSVWEGLVAVGAADCPMCGTRMERSAAGGSCGGCGTTMA